MKWGRILIVNTTYAEKLSLSIRLGLSHWFNKTHRTTAASSRTDWALWRRQAWLCSDKDMLNSASHYLHFFFPLFPASRKLKGMQINTSLCEGSRSELKQWSLMRSLQAWGLIGLSRPHGMGGKSMNRKGETNCNWVRLSFAEKISGFCVMLCCLRFQIICEAWRVFPWYAGVWPCCTVEYDEHVLGRWKGHIN